LPLFGGVGGVAGHRPTSAWLWLRSSIQSATRAR
jgi:hypothetical protein